MPQPNGLLVAIAHPDDEAFGIGGTMAKLVAAGLPVTLVCATRGEVGEISDPALATPETLGAVREGELREAAEALGVRDVRFLGYRDSGMEGTTENTDPRALCNAPTEAVADAIAAIMREVRPAVVVTWDLSGGYGHPDHIAVHHAATAAFHQLSGEAGGPAALYYNIIPLRLWEELERWLESRGEHLGSDEMRERARQLPRLVPTTEIDVSAHAAAKREAAARHRTQMPPRSPVDEAPPELRRRFFEVEYFARAAPPWHEGDAVEYEFCRQ